MEGLRKTPRTMKPDGGREKGKDEEKEDNEKQQRRRKGTVA